MPGPRGWAKLYTRGKASPQNVSRVEYQATQRKEMQSVQEKEMDGDEADKAKLTK